MLYKAPNRTGKLVAQMIDTLWHLYRVLLQINMDLINLCVQHTMGQTFDMVLKCGEYLSGVDINHLLFWP